MSNAAGPTMSGARLSSGLVSRNVTVNGRRTSVRLEQAMWDGLDEVAHRERMTFNNVFDLVAKRRPANLSFTGAVRGFLVDYYRSAATEEGHLRAGHGVITSKLSNRMEAVSQNNQRRSIPKEKTPRGAHQSY